MNKPIERLAVEEAQRSIESAMRIFNCGRKRAISINEYAIDFMLKFNPISTTPTDRESNYYRHWDLIQTELMGQRLGLPSIDESFEGYAK